MSSRADRTGSRQAARERTAARRAAEREAELRRRRVRLAAGVAAAVLVVVAIVVVVAVQSSRTDTTGAATPGNTAEGTDGSGFAVGAEDAPVVVDVYEDYLCPACRFFEADAGDVLDGLVADGTVLVRYRPVAILDRASDDEYSTRAANAAAVVADAEGGEALRDFHGLLFAAQPTEGGPGLPDDELIALAARAGADGDAVAAGIRDLRFGKWVDRVTEQASKAGMPGTPWVLVDGEPLQRPTGEGLAAAVAAAEGAA